MIRGRTIKNPPSEGVMLKASIHNKFDIEVIDAKTGNVKQSAVGYNTICNQLWSRLFAPNSYFNYIHYGDGTGTPSSGDTKLFSYLGGKAVVAQAHNHDEQAGVFFVRKRIQVLETEAIGKKISEVGIAYSSSSTSLCTHAMLQDMNGNKISIDKTPTDIINIYATIYIHLNGEGYDNGSIMFNSLKTNSGQFMDGYLKFISGHGNVYPSLADYSSGFALSDGKVDGFSCATNCTEKSVTHTFDLTNKKITATVARLAASEGNVKGLNMIHFHSSYDTGGNKQGGKDTLAMFPGGTWFPESVITGEAVGTGDGVTVDYELDFMFARDAVVYVDGIEVKDVTVDYICPVSYKNDASIFLVGLRSDSTPGNHKKKPLRVQTIYNTGEPSVYYNPLYQIGIWKFNQINNLDIEASDDLVNWHYPFSNYAHGNYTIADEYKHAKYWRFTPTASGNGHVYSMFLPESFTGKALHFATPPAAGSVITVDYKTDCIAKDSNHVFDLSFTIQLGEYTEAQ